MNIVKKLSLYVPVMVLALSVVAVPVFAHAQEDDSTSTTTTDDSTTSGSKRKGGRDRTKAEGDVARQENEDKIKARGAELLLVAKSEHKGKSKAELKKTCETRKNGMETRTARITANAAKHQARIDGLYAKIVAYKIEKNLTVADFDTLVAAADAAQTKSQDSVDALTALEPAVDCTDDTVATQVATFKAAAEQVRTDLKAYKTAARAVFTAVKSSQTDDADSSDDSTTTTKPEETTEGAQ